MLWKCHCVRTQQLKEHNSLDLLRGLCCAASDSSRSPPKLASGADDVFWVAQLHQGLDRAGFAVPDEEAEAWFFGEGTESALHTFQVRLWQPCITARLPCSLAAAQVWSSLSGPHEQAGAATALHAAPLVLDGLRSVCSSRASSEACVPAMQACQGLPETGLTDMLTWTHLLGEDALQQFEVRDSHVRCCTVELSGSCQCRGVQTAGQLRECEQGVAGV